MSMDYRPLPGSREVTESMLPAYRAAVRQRTNRVKMIVVGPLLMFFFQAAVEFAVKWLVAWLKERNEPVPVSLSVMAWGWDRDELPEVRVGMAMAARGEAGE